jgi:hypothetical protein
MKRLLCCMGLVAGLASAAQVNGVLIDKMCSSKAISGGQKAAAEHDKDCALADPCQKSGYGVYTSDGKYLTFDEEGNKKALAALKATKKTDELKVTVTGDVDGDKIKVASLKMQ